MSINDRFNIVWLTYRSGFIYLRGFMYLVRARGGHLSRPPGTGERSG